MTQNIIKNQEFYTCPDNFYYVGADAGSHLCSHTNFTKEVGTKNVIGQYRITRKCNDCHAYRTYFLYAKVARKGRK
jgi:hypothetical protein